jgi:hypothetical protein
LVDDVSGQKEKITNRFYITNLCKLTYLQIRQFLDKIKLDGLINITTLRAFNNLNFVIFENEEIMPILRLNKIISTSPHSRDIYYKVIS